LKNKICIQDPFFVSVPLLAVISCLAFSGRCLNKRINPKATNCNIGCNKCRDTPTICATAAAATAEAAADDANRERDPSGILVSLFWNFDSCFLDPVLKKQQKVYIKKKK